MIAIASDHGGFELKSKLINSLTDIDFLDLGTHTDQRVDYPGFADKLCNSILQNKATSGILICGTGIGISIRANRYNGIRAALVYNEFTAEMAKAHNDANVICLGGRTTSFEMAVKLISIWNETKFEAGRHTDRLRQLDSPLTST